MKLFDYSLGGSRNCNICGSRTQNARRTLDSGNRTGILRQAEDDKNLNPIVPVLLPNKTQAGNYDLKCSATPIFGGVPKRPKGLPC